MWAGDQEADWSQSDGIPTVVTAGLTIGLAGIPYFTHDIAGFSGGPSTKELFQRWTELGAFTPVMRTHDGLKKHENHNFNTDQETLEHFVLFSKIHAALLPYLKLLAQQAVDQGLPMVRHTVLIDHEWEKSFEAHKQWMLGSDILFAPVVEQGTESIDAYLPEGEWEHLLTGDTFTGRQIVNISAPVGMPDVLVMRQCYPRHRCRDSPTLWAALARWRLFAPEPGKMHDLAPPAKSNKQESSTKPYNTGLTHCSQSEYQARFLLV